MDYLKHYLLLREKAKSRNIAKGKGIYTESHHIVPKSEGGSNSKDNLVDLYPREHFIAHWLLYRINPTISRAFSFNMMASTRSGRYTTSSRAYAEGVEAASIAQSKNAKGRKVLHDPINKKEKYVPLFEIDYWIENGFKLGRIPGSRNKGRKWYNDGEKEIFSTLQPPGYKLGRLRMSNTLNKVAVSKKNKVSYINPEDLDRYLQKGYTKGNVNHNKPWKKYKGVILTCPVCSKTGGFQGMKRNHFDNCKQLISGY